MSGLSMPLGFPEGLFGGAAFTPASYGTPVIWLKMGVGLYQDTGKTTPAAIGECALVDGWHDTTQLGDGVCHLEGTATIEHEWARIVLAGHTPGAFDDLVYVEQGDQIVIWDAHTIEVYRVILIATVAINDVSWLMPTPDETLTLITCSGPRRLIVHAEKES